MWCTRPVMFRSSIPTCSSKLPLQWLKASQKIPAWKIMPLELGGEREVPLAAWKGDAFLKAALAKALTIQQEEKKKKQDDNNNSDLTVGEATSLAKVAVSNSFLTSNISTLLPEYAEEAKGLSEHQAGTMLEAAVASVHATNEDAILDLANWLIQNAPSHPYLDSKSSLLNLGGNIESERIGGSDHETIYKATATLHDETVEATGIGKKRAELAVATKLLTGMNLETPSDDEDYNVLALTPDDEKTLGQWEKDEILDANMLKLKLRDGDRIENWWRRGAMSPKDSFRRALLAPMVFPDYIEAVDSWTRFTTSESSYNTQVATFIIITCRPRCSGQAMEYKITSVCEGESKTQARKTLGVEANKMIAERLSIMLPTKYERKLFRKL